MWYIYRNIIQRHWQVLAQGAHLERPGIVESGLYHFLIELWAHQKDIIKKKKKQKKVIIIWLHLYTSRSCPTLLSLVSFHHSLNSHVNVVLLNCWGNATVHYPRLSHSELFTRIFEIRTRKSHSQSLYGGEIGKYDCFISCGVKPQMETG